MTVLDEHHDILPVGPPDLGAGTGPAWLDAWLAAHAGELVGWRRSLHAVPELGRAERRTTAFVAAALMAAGLEPRTLPSGTGLVCDVGYGERCVALRADIDALPLAGGHRPAVRARRSRASCHACGHDAHTAMLLGAGARARRGAALPGRVRLIFQPAEEIQPGGAVDVVADGALDGVERIFALHCDPRLRVGTAGHPGRADHGGVRPGGGAAHLAGRPHRAAAPDGRPGLRPRTADHRAAAAAHPAGRPAVGHRARVGRRARGRGGQRDPAARRVARHPAHGRPRHLGRAGAEGAGARRGDRRAARGRLHPRSRPRRAAGGERGRQLGDVGRGRARHRRAGGVGEHRAASGGEDFAWYLEQVPGAMARLGVWSGTGPMRDLHRRPSTSTSAPSPSACASSPVPRCPP